MVIRGRNGRLFIGAVLCSAFVIAAGLFWWAPHAEERRIRKRLTAFAHVVEKKKGSGALRVAVATERLPGFFADPVEVSVPAVGISGRFSPTELASHISRALLSVRRAVVRFPDVRIEALQGDRAEVVVTARLQALLRTGEDIDDVRELRCELRKIDGKWRFRRVEQQAVLER